MNMLDLPHAILTSEFFDNNNIAYRYIGRFCTDKKDEILPLITFCNINKIPYNYIFRQYQDTQFAIKIYPENCEIVYQIFISPYRDKLFQKIRTN